MEIADFAIKGKSCLEIGCYDGARGAVLLERGAAEVTATDIVDYPGLAGLRQAMSGLRLEPALRKRLIFAEDDITASALPSETFDAVFSWQVLEHVMDARKAFSNMYRLLKPGGVAFHEYNPFFSLSGGHSPCTLDFLWGHVLLDESDFGRYLQQFRPREVNMAHDFFTKSLNRMTLSDLKGLIRESGLRDVAVVPWPRESHLELLAPDTVSLLMAKYPTLGIVDLISPVAWVLAQKER
jgi:SAM-dependent methyltransferase